LDDSEFAWFSGFGYDAERRGLEGSDEGFNFRSRKGSNVTLLLKFELYDVVKFREVFDDGWFVGRGECFRNDWNTGVKAILKLMREVRVSCNKSTTLEESLPGIWFVR